MSYRFRLEGGLIINAATHAISNIEILKSNKA
jgi:hypothetical protein